MNLRFGSARVGVYFPMQPAYEIGIEDLSLQAYLQRWPYATGPDPEKNIAARKALRQCLRRRELWAGPSPVVLLAPEQTLLPQEEMGRIRSFLRELKCEGARERELMNDFAWEVNLVPRSARNVLDVGGGDGMELLFLRAVLPHAKITVVDYSDRLAPQVRRLVNPTVIAGDLNVHLRELPGGFDLIYSNHTLEHLYTPDQVMQTLYRLLLPGGSLISVLPMDANPGGLFQGKMARLAEAKTIHPLDIAYLDMGHPWKTNPADLHRTLLGAGYRQVTLYQRVLHRSRFARGGPLRLAMGMRIGQALCALSFGTVRRLARLLLPQREPARVATQVSRLLLAVERRVWFGTGRLKNHYAAEVLLHAVKPG